MSEPAGSALVRRELRFPVASGGSEVSALLLQPADARRMLVFGHGAGAGMRHPFMERMSERLAARQTATLRYQFPYMESGSQRPDAQPVLLATVRAAASCAAALAPGMPLLAGGKSMGGRMTSLAAAASPLPGVQGIVFFGFPLHPPNRAGTERAQHLREVTVPLLFLQGTRDQLADLERLRPVVSELGPRARLHIIDTADHSFHVLKRSGLTDDGVMDELADVFVQWASDVAGKATNA